MSSKVNSNSKLKPVIYKKVPNLPNICTIWDWSSKKQSYIKRSKGNKYYAYFKIRDKQVSKSFKSLNEAKEFVRLRGDISVLSSENQVLFIDVLNRFLVHQSSIVAVTTMETLKSKIKHLTFFHFIPMQSITARVIDDWLRVVKSEKYLKGQKKTRASYKHELSALRQIFRYYIDYECNDGEVFVSPLKARHKRDCIINHREYKTKASFHKTKFMPRSQMIDFIDHLKTKAEKKEKDCIFYLIALFQMRTGCRIGEVCALDWKNLDLLNKKALITRTVCWSRFKGRKTFISSLTKTGESRTVILTDDLVLELDLWSRKLGHQTGLVFGLNSITPVSYRSIQHRYTKAQEAIGSEYRGTHILRHSYATDVLSYGCDQGALQAQLGHKSSKQISHYAKITEEKQWSGIQQYNQSLNGIM